MARRIQTLGWVFSRAETAHAQGDRRRDGSRTPRRRAATSSPGRATTRFDLEWHPHIPSHNVCIRPWRRPLILVNCWRRELPTFLGERTRLDTLDPAYAERVSDAGGQPLLLSRPPAGGRRVGRGAGGDGRRRAADRRRRRGPAQLRRGARERPRRRRRGRRVRAGDHRRRARGRSCRCWRSAAAPSCWPSPTAAGCRSVRRRRTGTPSWTALQPDEILTARHPVTLTAGLARRPRARARRRRRSTPSTTTRSPTPASSRSPAPRRAG